MARASGSLSNTASSSSGISTPYRLWSSKKLQPEIVIWKNAQFLLVLFTKCDLPDPLPLAQRRIEFQRFSFMMDPYPNPGMASLEKRPQYPFREANTMGFLNADFHFLAFQHIIPGALVCYFGRYPDVSLQGTMYRAFIGDFQ